MLGYSQSAVSQQIAALESVAGGRLLERNERLAPTSAGEIVLRRARAIRRELASLEHELDALRTTRCGTLRVAAHHPAATRVLPRLASVFRSDMELSVHAAPTSAAALGAVEVGDAELAVVALPVSSATALETMHLLEARLVAVVASCARASHEPFSNVALARNRLLCLSSCPATEALLHTLAMQRIEHEVAVWADDEATLVQLARLRAGVALLPGHALLEEWPGVAVRELETRHILSVRVAWCPGEPRAEEVAKLLSRAALLAVEQASQHALRAEPGASD